MILTAINQSYNQSGRFITEKLWEEETPAEELVKLYGWLLLELFTTNTAALHLPASCLPRGNMQLEYAWCPAVLARITRWYYREILCPH